MQTQYPQYHLPPNPNQTAAHHHHQNQQNQQNNNNPPPDQAEQIIYRWFMRMESWQRINLISNLLHHCHHLELRFLVTCAEDMVIGIDHTIKGMRNGVNGNGDHLKRKLNRKRTNYNNCLKQTITTQSNQNSQYQQTINYQDSTSSIIQDSNNLRVMTPPPDNTNNIKFNSFTPDAIAKYNNTSNLNSNNNRSFTPPPPLPTPQVPNPENPTSDTTTTQNNTSEQTSFSTLKTSSKKLKKLDFQFLHELQTSLALLSTKSYEIATVLFEFVAEYIDQKIMTVNHNNHQDISKWYNEMRSLYSMTDISNLLLLATMVVLHPAFTCQQKEHVFIKYCVLETLKDTVKNENAGKNNTIENGKIQEKDLNVEKTQESEKSSVFDRGDSNSKKSTTPSLPSPSQSSLKTNNQSVHSPKKSTTATSSSNSSPTSSPSAASSSSTSNNNAVFSPIPTSSILDLKLNNPPTPRTSISENTNNNIETESLTYVPEESKQHQFNNPEQYHSKSSSYSKFSFIYQSSIINNKIVK